MKAEMEYQDRAGRYCMKVHSTNLKEINEWLYHQFGGEGYKFVIEFDTSHDEFEPWGNDTLIYFADEVLKELAEFYDQKLSKKDRTI